MPKYFIIRWSSSPLWKEFIHWLNTTYGCDFTGTDESTWYGYTGNTTLKTGCYNSSRLKDFHNNPVEITLEQWKHYTDPNYSPEIY